MEKVTTRPAKPRRNRASYGNLGRRWFWLLGLVVVLTVSATVLVVVLSSNESGPSEPPEAAKILEAQEDLEHFGVLIPAYLPRGFNRATVEVSINQSGQSGEPAVALAYRKNNGSAIFLSQWVPANADLEVLHGSSPIETKWGTGWLLQQSGGLKVVWVLVGQLRVSLSNASADVSPEQLVLAANTLGLASDLQVYSFVTELPKIEGVEPPPPFEVKLNAEGVQELNLTITPGGYSPMRFAVQKGIPVRINFRALGEVGCGNACIFPAEPDKPVALQLTREQTLQVLDFTPQVAGEFQFQCTNNCFRGIMTVREGPQQ